MHTYYVNRNERMNIMKRYKSRALTCINSKKINKPNEDFYLCDDKNQIYFVADGVSRDKINGVYPNPSPSEIVTKLFVQKSYKYILDNIKDVNKEKLLNDSIKYGNECVNKYNSTQKWVEDFLPGTVVVIILIYNEQVYYSYVGDCYGFVINNRFKRMFTRCQTEKLVKSGIKFDRITIRNVICNNIENMYSYGVLNGDVNALKFVQSGKFKFNKNDKIFLCSDGVSEIMLSTPSQKLYKMNEKEIIIKSKDIDDKTVVIIEEKNG